MPPLREFSAGAAGHSEYREWASVACLRRYALRSVGREEKYAEIEFTSTSRPLPADRRVALVIGFVSHQVARQVMARGATVSHGRQSSGPSPPGLNC